MGVKPSNFLTNSRHSRRERSLERSGPALACLSLYRVAIHPNPSPFC